MKPSSRTGHGFAVEKRLPEPSFAVHELIAKPPPVTEEVAVHFVVIAIDDAPQSAIAFAGIDVATQSTMDANRRSELLIPLARVVALQSLIREYTCRTNLDEVPAELILQNTIFIAAEEYRVARRERVQIFAARVVAVIAYAAVTLNASVRLMIHQRAQILVAKCALVEFVVPVIMTGHDGHILQMALAAFIAHRAIMRMIQHESLNYARTERGGLRIRDGNPCAFYSRRHAGHYDFALRIVLILELFLLALAASAHRA